MGNVNGAAVPAPDPFVALWRGGAGCLPPWPQSGEQKPPKEGRVAVLLDGSTKAKSVKLDNLRAVPSTCGGGGAGCAEQVRWLHAGGVVQYLR